MARSVHVIGNGDWVHLYTRRERKGLNLTCNLAPFPYPKNHYATCIVDFKMMKAMTEGTVVVPGEWVLGYRPKVWMEKNPNFHLSTARQIKEFYLDLPKYAGNYRHKHFNFSKHLIGKSSKEHRCSTHLQCNYLKTVSGLKKPVEVTLSGLL